MFDIEIDKEVVQEVREFLVSDKCEFVANMAEAGLSVHAILLVLQSIEDKCKEVEAELEKED